MTTDEIGGGSFDIIKEPWLDVLRVDGTVEVLSLRQVMANAHCIARISEPSPLTEVAVLRFLIALTSDGLRNEILAEGGWVQFARRCRGGFPSKVVETILGPLAARSNVLDPDHDGLFDGPAVTRVAGWSDPNARQPVSRFLPEIPAGTNLAHFRHVSDGASALCVACLLKSRFVEAAFARGGLGPSLSRHLLATIGGMEPRYVVPHGETLLGTLLLNLVVGDPSRPSWVSIHRAEDGEPGPIARMTWRPRLVVPLESSRTTLPCACCGTTDRTRFAHAVMVDTYNHKGSPFGGKLDVERWKLTGGDVHLLRSEKKEKNSVPLGLRTEEWPLRAIVRLLAGEASPVLDWLSERIAASDTRVWMAVTSSAGNQAKIDDARHAAASIPAVLLARSDEHRAAMAAAMTKVFDKANGQRRRALIPAAVPGLLSDLAACDVPQPVVAAWLERGEFSHIKSAEGISKPFATDGDDAAQADDPLLKAARNAINRLARLSERELAALRGRGFGATADPAAWQTAFEKVWHGLVLPTGCPRHAFREALATVASLYATYRKNSFFFPRRQAFEEQLEGKVNSERSARVGSTGHGPVTALLRSIIDAPPGQRDELLLRLVNAVAAVGPNPHSGRIDFASLLLEVAHWNDPVDSTPARWRRILRPFANAAR